MNNWHQKNATRRMHKMRNIKAHILANNYIETGLALCGMKPKVYVERQHANNPANSVCKKCLAKTI